MLYCKFIISANEGAYSTTTADNVSVTLTERSGMAHVITPSFRQVWDITDTVKLGFSAALPIGIGSGSFSNSTVQTQVTRVDVHTDANASYTSTTTTKNHSSGLVESTTLEIFPTLAVGTQFAMLPERFTLNAGFTFTPVAYSKVTEKRSPNGYQTVHERVVYDNGYVSTDEVTASLSTGRATDRLLETVTWRQMSGDLQAGFTFFFAPTFALDTHFSAATAGFGVNLATVNVQFTLKK